ncbi:MAG: hypothetical protein CVV27_20540, partial [Candidatus Melainabacteria bacterium HGW-Melainabacteria-1]
MRRPLLFASATTLILAGCATGAALIANPRPADVRQQGTRNPVSVVQQVSSERIRATAAVLTGQAKF